MATIESLVKRLNDLDQIHGYFTIEDIVSVYWQPVPGESWIDTLQREHPFKTFNPAMLEYFFKQQSPEDGPEKL